LVVSAPARATTCFRNSVFGSLSIFSISQFGRLGPAPGARRNAARHKGRLVRVGPVRIAISALAPFRPPGWGSVGCRTFVELNLSGALDARHHQGDSRIVSGGLCQRCGTAQNATYFQLSVLRFRAILVRYGLGL
jgi:hypothetical protein